MKDEPLATDQGGLVPLRQPDQAGGERPDESPSAWSTLGEGVVPLRDRTERTEAEEQEVRLRLVIR